MTSKEIATEVKRLDAMLDNDAISDAEFDAIEAQIRALMQKQAEAERVERLQSVPELKNPSEWMRGFLSGFCKTGTYAISNTQARVFKRERKPVFAYNGYIFECRGANYRAGFSHVFVTKV